MLTRNFENILSSIIASSSIIFGHLPILGVNGLEYFLTNNFAFPGSRSEAFTLDKTAAGISIGIGNTAPTKTDTNLEDTITSGVNVVVTSKVVGCDTPGSPYLEYTLTVTNTGSSPLTITEIGYKQTVKAAAYPGATSSADVVCLLDRSVFDDPIVIQAGDAGVIKYTLKTTPITRSKAGVDLVSFTYGSDEDVAAMIDAARNGLIDLQTDGGWAVGDYRKIHIDAFTGGGSKAHAAQDIDIVISQFGDYNSCGCLFQFDFVESLAVGQRMNSSNTNSGGYGASEMYTTTIPALVEALPSWLKSRLRTFDVLASAGSQSATIDTVSGNKLALRSEIELLGSTPNSKAGEGSQIDWYKAGTAPRTKRLGRTGSASSWWERSPYGSNSTYFCYVSNSGNASSNNASLAYGLAPFGCI